MGIKNPIKAYKDHVLRPIRRRVRRLRQKAGLTGKQIKSKIGWRPSVNSASSYGSSDIYGPTGSIVGRY